MSVTGHIRISPPGTTSFYHRSGRFLQFRPNVAPDRADLRPWATMARTLGASRSGANDRCGSTVAVAGRLPLQPHLVGSRPSPPLGQHLRGGASSTAVVQISRQSQHPNLA